jgi:HlyD family secretion protein
VLARGGAVGLAELKAKRLEKLARDPGASPRAAAMDRKVEARLLTPRAALNAAGVLLMVAVAAYWALHFGRNSVRVDRSRLTLSSVSQGVFRDYIPVTGSVQAETTVYLDVAQGGQVEERLVEEGASVHAGEALVRFRNTALELQVTAQEAQLAESLFQLSSVGLQMQDSRLQHQRDLTEVEAAIADSERRLARLRPLLADGFVRRADVDDEEATLRRYRGEREAIAEARVLDVRAQADQTRQLNDALAQLRRNHQIALHNLEDLVVRAPIDGQLTTLDAEIGASKIPGQHIGQIDREGAFKVSVPVDEFYLGRVANGQEGAADIEGRAWNLVVNKIHPEVKNRQFSIDMQFRAGPPASLRRGQSVQIRLEIGEPSQGLVVENGPFYDDSGGRWVFVVSSDGHRADKRTVSLGRHTPQSIEVLSGLAAGERIVTSSTADFRDIDTLDISGGSNP